MNKSESIAGLATALAKAQSELSNPKKTSTNPFFNKKYADLSEVINVSKQVLSEHGLSILQLPSFSDGKVHVETMLIHSTGEFISDVLSLPVTKQDPQSVGIAITYARRYSWAAICGLAQEDDDAEGAMDRTPKHEQKSSVDPNIIALKRCTTEAELGLIWNKFTKEEQRKYAAVKDDMKRKLSNPSHQDAA